MPFIPISLILLLIGIYTVDKSEIALYISFELHILFEPPSTSLVLPLNEKVLYEKSKSAVNGRVELIIFNGFSIYLDSST